MRQILNSSLTTYNNDNNEEMEVPSDYGDHDEYGVTVKSMTKNDIMEILQESAAMRNAMDKICDFKDLNV